jgi:hypothetical protein
MSDWEERRRAEEAGRQGGAAPSNQHLDDWQRGKSIADWNKAELARQQTQSSPPLFSAGDSTGSWGSSAGTTGSWSPGAGSGGSAINTSTATSSGAGCLLVPVLAILGFYFWPALYPFSALASLAGAAGTYLLLRNVLPATPEIPLNGNAAIAASVVALVVLWMTSRLDHRLARRPAYRIVRHMVRLGILAIAVSIKLQGVAVLSTSFPRGWRPFADPVEGAIVLVVLVASHFLMWTNNAVRETWHGMLEAIRLR